MCDNAVNTGNVFTVTTGLQLLSTHEMTGNDIMIHLQKKMQQ